MALAQIPVGDWSGDGHNICDYYTVEYNEDAQLTISAAFLAAEAMMPTLSPGSFCNKYEDSKLPPHIQDKFTELGIPFEDGGYVEDESFVEYFIWFVNQGDPSLQMKRAIDIPPWHPWGTGIGALGYGLKST